MEPRIAIEDPTVDHMAEMRNKPFFDLTAEMFRCVRDHDFATLSGICDDDFGIVDINVEGGSQVIRDRAGWEQWFKGLFAQLKEMGATTWSEITRYEAVEATDMGYSVVDFDQVFIGDGRRLRFSVLATIVWKRSGDGWKEARYHSSLLKVAEE
jgi:ketosteroid isomerase-like protein